MKATSKSSRITPITNDLSNSFMIIEYNNSQPLTKYTKILLYKFMTLLNGYIGANTNLNYHILPVKDFRITIPIYVYTNDEKKLSPSELIENRVNTLISTLENIDWLKSANIQEQWLIYSLKTEKIDISTDFTLTTQTNELSNYQDRINEPLHINYPELKKPTVKRIKYSDGSVITYLSSPYLSDYGVFANLSTTFDEMGMSFNALHLYEHLMTYAWKGLDFSKVKLMNGSTWPHALCSVFVITSNLETLKMFTASYIKFYLESRTKGFWEQQAQNKGVILETQRTMSETRTERTLSSLCRSDPHAYDFGYNTKIFEYWSNRPFDILITGPDNLSKLFMNEQTINSFIGKHPIQKINRPMNVKYKHLPLDTIKMKVIHQFRITKANTEEIKNSLLHPSSISKSLYGVDAKVISEIEDLAPYNSVLHVLCYMNKLFTTEELNEFVQNTIIPFSSAFLSETSLSSKFAGDFLYDPNTDTDDVDLFQPYDANETITNDENDNGNDSSNNGSSKRKKPRHNKPKHQKSSK